MVHGVHGLLLLSLSLSCLLSLSLSLVCSLSLSLMFSPLSLSLSCSLSPPLSLSLSSAPYSHCLDISSFHCLDESSSIYMVVHCFLALFLSQGPDIQTVLANPTVRFFGSCMDFFMTKQDHCFTNSISYPNNEIFRVLFSGFCMDFSR